MEDKYSLLTITAQFNKKKLHPKCRGALRLIGLFVAVALSGCDVLTVRSIPDDATITIRNTAGVVQSTGPSALQTKGVSFDASNPKYTIDIVANGVNAEVFYPYHGELTQADYLALPGPKGDKSKEIALLKKPFDLVIDPRFSGGEDHLVVLRQRSFQDVAEQGGAAPTKIVEFDENLAISGLALSPDGTQLVFSATPYDAKATLDLAHRHQFDHLELPLTSSNLHGVKVTGGGLQHITDENFVDIYPSFTSDGKFLIFSSNRRRTRSRDVLRTASEGRSGISNIYTDQRNSLAEKPTQANDGTIAFAIYPDKWTRPEEVQVWTIGGPNQFPTQIAIGDNPCISPDGKHIAYIGVDGNLWVVNADGSNATQLTNGAAKILQRYRDSLKGDPDEARTFDYYQSINALLRYYPPNSFPAWSPDGRRIVFTSMEGSDPTGRPNDDIWIMNADGSGREQLTTNGSVDRFPVISPDMKHVYFYSNRGRRWAIWRIPLQPSSQLPPRTP